MKNPDCRHTTGEKNDVFEQDGGILLVMLAARTCTVETNSALSEMSEPIKSRVLWSFKGCLCKHMGQINYRDSTSESSQSGLENLCMSHFSASHMNESPAVGLGVGALSEVDISDQSHQLVRAGIFPLQKRMKTFNEVFI